MRFPGEEVWDLGSEWKKGWVFFVVMVVDFNVDGAVVVKVIDFDEVGTNFDVDGVGADVNVEVDAAMQASISAGSPDPVLA
jgi:hypothetical protein